MKRFAATLEEYGLYQVVGDRYAGETFRADFAEHGIHYQVSPLTKSEIYEAFEPMLNAGEVELLDHDRMQTQFLGLVTRGARIDHLPGEHDDFANAAAGALWAVGGRRGLLGRRLIEQAMTDDVELLDASG